MNPASQIATLGEIFRVSQSPNHSPSFMRTHPEQLGQILSIRMALLLLAVASGLPGLAIPDAARAQTVSPEELLEQIADADQQGQGDQLLAASEQLLKLAPKPTPRLASVHYWRGRELFRRGKMAESVKEFDRYVELVPQQEPRQWERGIALYYAGQFERGAKQFELYQTFDNRDVENSVWRFLCVARASNVAKARETLLPIEQDRRIPMMKIYDLYAGKAQPDDVLETARAGDPPADALAARLFYAHLYLGLYFEALGQQPQADKYLQLAADPKLRGLRGINVYMWAVADVGKTLRVK